MDRLADMIESTIKSAGERNIRRLLDSPAWQEVMLRYDAIHLELLIQGHKGIADPLDDCFRQLEKGMVELARQQNPPKLNDVYLFWDMRLCAKLRAMAQVREQITENSPIQPKDIGDAEPNGGSKADVPAKRPWTAPELDEAIREYVAKRSKRYQDFISILDDPSESPRRKNLIQREARKMFGRNVVATALGVKSPRMVSQSSAWLAVASTLGFPLKRNQIGKPASRRQKVGIDIAVEKASMAADGGADHAPADAQLLLREQAETLRRIHQFGESGLPDAAPMAASLLQKYKVDEITDDQVRQTIETLQSPV
ncbi:MAG: hypothetical protein H8E35_13625 [Ardenticatenia bacterium]|nr:hypothetical protein [Ardenticatenia bacterium]